MGGLTPAVRARAAIVSLLVALAAAAWLSSAQRMAGMDMGPGTSLGSLGWFTGVWVVMMAAMMLPSVAPTVALYARMTRRHGPPAPLAFAAGYLLTWGAAGVLAYGVCRAGAALPGDALDWDAAGRPLAGGVLLLAAAYELSPYKLACLTRCRTPLGFLLGAWRDGLRGGLQMGARHGLWCLGCCWALMASLFALGVMSLTWMAVVAVLIGVEKLLPWRRPATWGTAAVLVVLGVLLLAAPGSVPGLTVPGGGDAPGTAMTMG